MTDLRRTFEIIGNVLAADPQDETLNAGSPQSNTGEKMNSLCRLLAVLTLFALTASPALGQDKHNPAKHASPAGDSQSNSSPAAIPAEYDAVVVQNLLKSAQSHGDPSRGVMVFGSEKFTCISCHKIGDQGGTVGPDLTTIRKRQTPEQIIESLLWPNRHVKPEYQVTKVLTEDGKLPLGYKVREDEKTLVLRDPSSGKLIEIEKNTIELRQQSGSLMPSRVVSAMTTTQRQDLIRLLVSLGAEDAPPLKTITMLLMHSQAHRHGPATFEFDRAPLHPEDWPSWKEHVNRDRIYDFYAKQAEHFRQQTHRPPLLQGYPGLDGGEQGHWGNQDEKWWADGRWKETDFGSIQCGRLMTEKRGKRKLGITRAVCLQLGDGVSACFNPDTLRYEPIWKGGFVTTSSKRHGLVDGLTLVGKLQKPPTQNKPDKPFVYRGYYRHGNRVVFSYRIGGQEYLDAPSVRNGKFLRKVAPADEHPLRHLTRGGPSQWPQKIRTEIKRGTEKPYAIDRIGLPIENPWKALIYCAGHDFLPDGSAVICTFQGYVWHVSGFGGTSKQAIWRRYASGLNQAMGVVTVGKDVYVQGRDQITRLHDLNDDGEADFYECFSNAFKSSFAAHDFVCGLERDTAGNFYTATSDGLIRISPDGKRADVIATGFRNPDGLGLMPDGTLTVPSSEGAWTPASMISAVHPITPNALRNHTLIDLGAESADRRRNVRKAIRTNTLGVRSPKTASSIPHFGHRGPREGVPPNLPLAYLPRALDNSSGGQVYVSSDQWGPLKGQLLHLSYGRGSHFLVLRDKVGSFIQGAVVPLPGEFRSGVHRGRFNPHDGQLYVTGMRGWGSYAPDDGCFDRVRYTGARVQLPIGFHVHENGVTLRFSEPVDPAVAEETKNQFAQCWNYRFGPAYGSPEFSSRHLRTLGHDVLAVASAHVLADRHTLFLEIPELQPVNQLHLYLRVDSGEPHELFVTVNKMATPFTDFAGYKPTGKSIARHPMLADLASLGKAAENPWRKAIPGSRDIRLQTGTNLTFARRSFRVKAGEPIKFTLVNPDVVPHNWVLVKPDSLERVGKLSNLLVADPDAFAKHYVPESDDVLVHTNVVDPRTDSTVYFHAPKEPGRYPYLCTFPGHWMVMNGVMIVESSDNVRPRKASKTPAAAPSRGASRKPSAKSGSPNVIVIMSDDMGYADLPKFGKSEIPTPNLDRLANEGVSFTDAYVTAPICVASRMGLQSGRYQQRFGVYCNFHAENQVKLARKATLLPVPFQQAGYRTGLVGKWHLAGNSQKEWQHPGPLTRGFDECVAITGGGSPFWVGSRIVRQETDEKSPAYLTDLWGTEAADFIERNAKDPFFLYLAFNAVHAPMHALDEDIAPFAKTYKDPNRRIYAGMLHAMDRAVGRVLDQLDKQGLAKETIVVFLNDNGGGGSTDQYAVHSRNWANNLPFRGHKFDIYEGGIRVPMMIRWPARLKAGSVYDKMVSSADIYRTVVSAAKLKMPAEKFDSVDLLPYLRGVKTGAPHDWLCWQNRSWLPKDAGGPTFPKSRVHNSAIRKDNWKLVRTDEHIDSDDPSPAWQLYDLVSDNGEQQDVAAKHPEVVRELGQLFNAWRAEMHPCIAALPRAKPGRGAEKKTFGKNAKPNIVIILADDFGWGDTSCNNPDTPLKTPAIDRIANEGIRFTNAHTPSAVCTPTRYGLLTGRHPWRSFLKKEVLRYYAPSLITKGRTTIPSYLKSQGYRTGGFGKWHLGLDWTPVEGDPANWRANWNVYNPADKSRLKKNVARLAKGIDHTKPFKNSPIDIGFDTYFGTASNCSRLPFFILDNKVFGNPHRGPDGTMRDPACARDKVDDIYVARAIGFIEEHEKNHHDKPFFVYLPLNAIHGAVSVPKRFAGKSNLAYREDKILWANESVGKMLAALDRMKLTDDTLVIFTADNGPIHSAVARKKGHHAAGPYRGFKTNAWDGGTRVPFLARWPEHISPGATTDHLIGLTDVLATIAGVCGSPLPDGAGPDSVNQIAALLQEKDKMVARRSLVTYSYAGFFTLRQGKWKAIFGTKWSGGHPGNSYGGPAPKGMAADNPAIGQLYDISVDPFEQNDLWKKRPKVVRSLRRELERIKQLDKPDEIRWEQGESPNRLIKETK